MIIDRDNIHIGPTTETPASTNETVIGEFDPNQAEPLFTVARDTIPSLVNFLDRGYNSQRERFNQLVKNSNGVCTLMVHPYMKSPFDDSQEYQNQLETILNSQHTRPLILLDDLTQDNPSIARIAKSIPTISNLMVVATNPTDPTPYYTAQENNENKSIADMKAWDYLANELARSGVKKVVLAGKNLLLGEPLPSLRPKSVEARIRINRSKELWKEYMGRTYPNLDPNLYPGGCVGRTAIELLSRNIDVLLSKTTSPENKFVHGLHSFMYF